MRIALRTATLVLSCMIFLMWGTNALAQFNSLPGPCTYYNSAAFDACYFASVLQVAAVQAAHTLCNFGCIDCFNCRKAYVFGIRGIENLCLEAGESAGELESPHIWQSWFFSAGAASFWGTTAGTPNDPFFEVKAIKQFLPYNDAASCAGCDIGFLQPGTYQYYGDDLRIDFPIILVNNRPSSGAVRIEMGP